MGGGGAELRPDLQHCTMGTGSSCSGWPLQEMLTTASTFGFLAAEGPTAGGRAACWPWLSPLPSLS